MKLLITGGCGFLGSNVAASFLADGNEVVVIDALFRSGSDSNADWLRGQAGSRQLTIHELDVAERGAVEGVFRESGPFAYVCHFAGQVAMTTSLADPHRDFLTNAMGTVNVLEAVRKFSPESLVAFSSTNKVYGDLEWLDYEETQTRYRVPTHPNGFDESLPLDFASPYGCSKGCADQYIRDWARNYGLKTVVFRHSSIYGGRQFSTIDQGWIGWFCRMALDQKAARDAGRAVEPFTISGTGKQVRDVLHADDLVALYRVAYERRDEMNGRIFNIGGGMDNSLSLLELFRLLESKLDVELAFQPIARRKSDQNVFVADVAKAGREMNWTPRVTKDQGIDRMLDWAGAIQNFSRS